MKSESGERLVTLIGMLGLKDSEFAKLLGKTPQYISIYKNGNRNIGNGFAVDIVRKFPNVNKKYLTHGMQPVLFTSDSTSDSTSVDSIKIDNAESGNDNILAEDYEILKAEINLLNLKINALEKKISILLKLKNH